MSSQRRRTRVLSFFFLVVLQAVFASSAFALRAIPHKPHHEGRHAIERLEESWRTAMLHADVSALDALLASDYMGITQNGTLQTRDELLASLRTHTLSVQTIELSDRKIRFYGTTALVTSRAEVTGTDSSGDLSGAYRYTHVYARTANGSWQIVSFEASRIREDDRH